MAGRDALSAALSLMKDPASVRSVRRGALPPGVASLLAVAVGEEAEVAKARGRTGYTDDVLEEAAAFFIEQILLDRRSDSYRVLGGTTGSSHAELRHNMAMLMRWLHPDRHALRSGADQDREIFTARVSRAWENLKSDERRAAYERERMRGQAEAAPRRGPPVAGAKAANGKAANGKAANGKAQPGAMRRWPTLSAATFGAVRPRRMQPRSLWNRILGLFRRRP
ncbi:J domain-containing protein [Aquabacter cavernae]|uniref:J domain-containing protein n=1 Tax=Aquabacter cavernae TaxID=2496029 RepID=UPI000F8F2872|nr:DnaJ domain-containing protein [Aquabacter cavernae]